MRLWGSRFEGQPTAKAEAFGASIGFDQRLWSYDIMGSAAHCRMLARQGIIGSEDADAILRGLAQVADDFKEARLDLAPSWEDIHTRVEGRLRELIGEPAERLHTARSRNDQVALDLRMFSRDAILSEVEALIAVQGALITAAAEFRTALMPGYTHLQRAQPVVLGHHLLAYGEMFSRDAERLLDCYRRTDVCPLGSGALAGVPYPIDREETARLLGFDGITKNSIDAVADRDFVVEHLAALALIAVHLSRMAEELVLWSSAEFGFLRLSDAHSTGSSIMPQKRNPDTAELIRGKSGRVFGHLTTLLTILKGLPLAYNKDLQEDKEALFDAVDTVLACLDITAEMVSGMKPRLEPMAASAGATFSTATDYADYLVKKGLPFREAHAIVGLLVRASEQRGCDIADLTLELLREHSPLFERDAVGITAAASASSRAVPGGTAPSQVASAIDAARQRNDELAQEVAVRRAALPTLSRLLDTSPLEARGL